MDRPFDDREIERRLEHMSLRELVALALVLHAPEEVRDGLRRLVRAVKG